METYEPETDPFEDEEKPLLTSPEPTPIIPIVKKNKKIINISLLIILGIIIGVALVIVAVQFNMSSVVTTTDNCILGMQESFNLGVENILVQLTNESINCRQIPINYSNYSYTLISIECLQQNLGGEQ